MTTSTKTKKHTPTAHDIHPLIKSRWSPRAFSTTPLTEKEMHVLLEAGRWAASSNNLQPWRIIWGLKGTETYDRIFNCLGDFNKSWVKHSTQALWLGCIKKDMANGEKENFHALHDLGLFMGNVSMQAESMGIALHQMAGIKFNDARKEFNFPDNYHVATAIAFGYHGGDAEGLPSDLKEQELQEERKRKPQSDFAFNGDFQK